MGTGDCIFKNEIFNYIEFTPIHYERKEKEFPDLIQSAIDDGKIVKTFIICDQYTNINSKEEAISSYNTILSNIAKNEPNAIIKWVTFANMLVKTDLTREIFVWLKRDESFWNILIVWMWWIFVNVFEDVSRRVWLVSKNAIKNMLTELISFPILEWVRWQKWMNFDNLINIIFNLQFVFEEFKDITEIDINPIFSDERDSIVVDAKFYL